MNQHSAPAEFLAAPENDAAVVEADQGMFDLKMNPAFVEESFTVSTPQGNLHHWTGLALDR